MYNQQFFIMAMIDNFDEIIGQDKLTLVDFYATWCGPCKIMHPVLDRIEKMVEGRVNIVRLDIDDPDNMALVRRYGIMSVPTFIFFKNGVILRRETGAMPYEKLADMVESYEKDMTVR